MPKGHSKKASKCRAPNSLTDEEASAIVVSFLQLLSSGERHDYINETCRLIHVPDYKTRSGMKTCNSDFTAISSRLNAVAFSVQHRIQMFSYGADELPGLDLLSGNIVTIYAGLAEDVLLRSRIFAEARFLDIALPLLSRSSSGRNIVMGCLSSITHYNTDDALEALARQIPTILQAGENNIDDITFADKTVCVLSHSAMFATGGEQGLRVDVLPRVHIPRLIRFFLMVMRQTHASKTLFHILLFFQNSTDSCHDIYKSMPTAVDFMVACTRSSDIRRRRSALVALYDLYRRDVEVPPNAQGVPFITPTSEPPNVRRALDAYGRHRTERVLNKRTVESYFGLMNDFAAQRDPDLYDFGTKLVHLVLENERFFRRCPQNPDSQYSPSEIRIDPAVLASFRKPLTTFADAIPLCVEAIRKRGGTSNEDKADILEIEYLLSTHHTLAACTLARKALRRNPQVAFFYFVLAESESDDRATLRLAKDGLKCSDLPLYFRLWFLRQCAFKAHNMSLKLLGYSQATSATLNAATEIESLVNNGITDTTLYLADCPPDGQNMPILVYLRISMTLLGRGHKLSPDLGEFSDDREKIALAADVDHMFKRKPLLGCVQRPVCEKIMDRMKESWADWGDAISRCDGSAQVDVPNVTKNTTQTIPSNVDTALDRLDATLSMEDIERGIRLNGADPMVDKYGEAQLYHCAWCGVPSAVLKRCTVCHKVRYCNSTCQKNDWKRHRTTECTKDDETKRTPVSATD